MWLIKAQSPLLLGGTPRQKRLYGSLSALSAPHLSSENGGLATTQLNFIRRSFSTSSGLFRVSHHSIRALSKPCRNMFIRQSAQVLPLDSMPKRAKLRFS